MSAFSFGVGVKMRRSIWESRAWFIPVRTIRPPNVSSRSKRAQRIGVITKHLLFKSLKRGGRRAKKNASHTFKAVLCSASRLEKC